MAIEAGSTPGDGESGECFSSVGEGGPIIDSEIKLINSERWLWRGELFLDDSALMKPWSVNSE